MKTVHLVYPHGTRISTPDSIGRNLANYLSKKYVVKFYDWMSWEKIIPSVGDILIGHANPNPYTVFRRSMKDVRWLKVILLQPFSTYRPHVAYLEHIFPYIDGFAAITGGYWVNEQKKGIYKSLEKYFYPIDLAVDLSDFPKVKNNFNERGKRRFLYIGNSDPCKNLSLFKSIAEKVGSENFGTVGAQVEGISYHGVMDFSDVNARGVISQYDFLLVTSFADANPTVVLEAMAWGLLPICTETCGYTSEDGVYIIRAEEYGQIIKDIIKFVDVNESFLLEWQRKNYELLKAKFSWVRFCEDVMAVINMPKQPTLKGRVSSSFRVIEVMSDRFFLRPSNIIRYLKFNIARSVRAYRSK